jgi:hypothetical protein
MWIKRISKTLILDLSNWKQYLASEANKLEVEVENQSQSVLMFNS